MKKNVYSDLSKSPAYTCKEYDNVISDWDYLHQLYTGVTAWSQISDNRLIPNYNAELFLPRHPQETIKEYNHRFSSTDFDDAYQQTLRGFVDMCFSNGVNLQADPLFMDQWQNLSLTGASGDTFLPSLAQSCLKIGVTYCFIDYDSETDRPYWVGIDPRNCPNWSYKFYNGKIVLNHVTIKTKLYAIVDSVEVEQIYYTTYYHGGNWVKYQYLFEDKNHTFIEVDKGVLMAKGKPMESIPLVAIHSSPYRPSIMVGEMQFRSLADKNRALYQVNSDYRRKMSLCSTPQPIRYDPMGQNENLTLSPSSIIDLQSPDAFFKWEEPGSRSLTQSRIEKTDIEQNLINSSSKFLKDKKPNSNVSQTMVSIKPLSFSLISFVNSYIEGIKRCIDIHYDYLGLTSDYSVNLEFKLIDDKPRDSQSALAIQSLYKSGAITRHSAIRLLKHSGFLDQDILDYELSTPDIFFVADQG